MPWECNSESEVHNVLRADKVALDEHIKENDMNEEKKNFLYKLTDLYEIVQCKFHGIQPREELFISEGNYRTLCDFNKGKDDSNKTIQEFIKLEKQRLTKEQLFYKIVKSAENAKNSAPLAIETANKLVGPFVKESEIEGVRSLINDIDRSAKKIIKNENLLHHNLKLVLSSSQDAKVIDLQTFKKFSDVRFSLDESYKIKDTMNNMNVYSDLFGYPIKFKPEEKDSISCNWKPFVINTIDLSSGCETEESIVPLNCDLNTKIPLDSEQTTIRNVNSFTLSDKYRIRKLINTNIKKQSINVSL